MSDTFVLPSEEDDAIVILDNLLYAAIGIKGLGEWAYSRDAQGWNTDMLIASLRYGTDTGDTLGRNARDAYLKEFPMMDKILEKQVFPGNAPEMAYLEYKNTVRNAARRYGVGDALVSNDKIANYILGDLDSSEIVDRMNLAATAIATTPPETLAVLRDYYGVQSGDLMDFYLDTEAQEAELQKRYTAARIGTEAARQKFGVSQAEAENLAQRGISVSDAERGFATAAAQTSLMQGVGETVSRQDIYEATFGSQEAAQKLARVAQSRTGQFQGGGAFAAGESGVAGLGSSTT